MSDASAAPEELAAKAAVVAISPPTEAAAITAATRWAVVERYFISAVL